MLACNKRARGADIECFCEIDKLRSSIVDSAKEQGNLEVDSGRTATFSGVEMHLFSLSDGT
jgi:hypothetical protein